MMLARTAAARLAQRSSPAASRAFTSTSHSLNAAPPKDDKPDLFMPRITERRLNEGGPGGRQSNGDLRVAIFGATGFIGKHLCHQLGTYRIASYHIVMCHILAIFKIDGRTGMVSLFGVSECCDFQIQVDLWV